MRWYNMVFICMTLATCFALYQMKYDNRDLHKKVTEIEKKIALEQDAIKILRAEWSLLTQPERIEDLNEKYFGLIQLEPQQIWREKDLANLPVSNGIDRADTKKLENLIERSLHTSSIKVEGSE